MRNRIFAVGVLAIAAFPLCAITAVPVAVRTVPGGVTPGATGSSGVTSYVVGWTQDATHSYTNPTVTLTVQTASAGTPATASVYLMNKIGAGTTTANQLSLGSISVPGTASTPTEITVTLPGSITLAAGNSYYLVVTNMSSAFEWVFATGGATETPVAGTTYLADQADFASPAPGAYLPASTTFVGVSAGGSTHVLIFSTTALAGTSPTPTVPTLGAFGIVGAVMLLAFSGLLLLRRHSVNPIR